MAAGAAADMAGRCTSSSMKAATLRRWRRAGTVSRSKAQQKSARRDAQELALIRDAETDDDLDDLDRWFGLNSLAPKQGMDPAELAALRSPETRERHRRRRA